MKNNFQMLLLCLALLPFSMQAQTGGKVIMNFDSLPDFTLQFSPWQAVDIDTSATYFFQNAGFPHNSEKMAFIAFNPALTTPPMDTVPSIQPHSGTKFGACFSAVSPPNNDWFISPKVHLKYNGSFSLWLKTYTDAYGLEKYRIAVSETDSNPSSFTVISGLTALTAPLDWTKKTFSLSAYDNKDVFVAVQCVSNDAFIFMIDDLEIDPGTDVPGFPSSVTENFDGMEDFTKDLSPWTTADLSGGFTYGIQGHTFPHSGEPMAYIVFNPKQVTPPINTAEIQAHSGDKYAGCFASMPTYNPNNKWLISPRLQLGQNAKIGLWTETFNPEYGMEKYRICVSTKTNTPADFVAVSELFEAPMNWGYKVVDLSAYVDSVVYVGIQCVSNNTFLFMVDDIEISSTVGVEDTENADAFSVYPNPATDHVTITPAKGAKLLGISLTDFTGKKISDLIHDSAKEIITVDLPQVDNGMYFLSVLTDHGTIIKKILIER